MQLPFHHGRLVAIGQEGLRNEAKSVALIVLGVGEGASREPLVVLDAEFRGKTVALADSEGGETPTDSEGVAALYFGSAEPGQSSNRVEQHRMASGVELKAHPLGEVADGNLEALGMAIEFVGSAPEDEYCGRSQRGQPKPFHVGGPRVVADGVDQGIVPRAKGDHIGGDEQVNLGGAGHGRSFRLGSSVPFHVVSMLSRLLRYKSFDWERAWGSGIPDGAGQSYRMDFLPPDARDLAAAQELLRASRRVVVLTGAGISTDSGIPDFRGPDGLWTKDPAAEKLANIAAYRRDPEVRQRAWRRRLESSMWSRTPNVGHQALVDLERSGRLSLLITQNIDGLHRAAGTDPALLVEAHGNVREIVCLSCDLHFATAEIAQRVEDGELDPLCRNCGGILKPAVVFFGENLNPVDLERSFEASAACDLFLTVGTSLAVFPINETVTMARDGGARIVIINGEPTMFDRFAQVVLRSSISATLPALVSDLPPV